MNGDDVENKSEDVCESFAYQAKTDFKYLVDIYGFELTNEYIDHLNCKIIYTKSTLKIELDFNIIDELIYLRIFRKSFGDWPMKIDKENVVNFSSLLSAYKPALSIKDFQPQGWKFEKPLERISILFREVASDILSEVKWVSEFELIRMIEKDRLTN
ncbi:MAG TPA: hypothetical protein PLV21_06740 [Cyclobacteriaceae bacterium]|nr:hypothetical protein [Cyclobacteriaceae bacterium]HRJ81560.1 hypothetical protein [Cyclobacteriaceae bacterium]